MHLDHIVLWVDDPLKSVAFYVEVLGLTAIRIDEFRAKQVLFPSVRISDDSIIDLMPRSAAPTVDAIAGAKDTSGRPLNHVCLAMSKAEFDALAGRLEARGTPPGRLMENSFGARGIAPNAFYFKDLDGNVLEARHYE